MSCLPAPLMAFLREGERFVQRASADAFDSQRLGLRLEVGTPLLRFVDLETGGRLATGAEARHEAEAARARVAALEAELQ